MVPIHLTKMVGASAPPHFRAISRSRVPALELSSGEVLTQSLAIIIWTTFTPNLPLPADALATGPNRGRLRR